MASRESYFLSAMDRSRWVDAVKSYMMECPGALCLDLESKGVGIAEIESILAPLPTSKIIELNLKNNNLEYVTGQLCDLLIGFKIKKLNVSSCHLTNHDMMQMMLDLANSEITHLDVTNNEIDFRLFCKGTFLFFHLLNSNLTSFSFDSKYTGPCYFSSSGDPNVFSSLFVNLANSKLTELSLKNVCLSKDEIKTLSGYLMVSQLEKLHLSGSGIDDIGLLILANGLNSSTIVDLDLSNNKFLDWTNLGSYSAEIRTLSMAGNLVKYCNYYFPFFDDLKSSSIVEFDVSNCHLSNIIGLQLVKSLVGSKITKLLAAGNDFDDLCLQKFCCAAKRTNIVYVDLSDNKFQYNTTFDFCFRDLKESKLQHISINNNNGFSRQPEFEVALFDLLTATRGSSITAVNIRRSNLVSNNIERLAPHLKGTTLTHFNLSSNHIEDGIGSLVASLKFTALTHLDISNCNIRDRGVEQLVLCLKQTPIVDLNISGNAITDHGADTLSSNLKQTNLLFLKLSHNQITYSGLSLLARNVENTLITILDVSSNPGSNTSYVDEVLWKNRTMVHVLGRTFKQIAPKDSSNDFSFGNIETGSAGTFLENCLLLHKTSKEYPVSLCVLMQQEGLTLTKDQFTKQMSEEFPKQFSSFIGRSVEANVAQHVDFLRKAENWQLNDLVGNLLLNRPLYMVDVSKGILHPFVYKLLLKYKQPICSSALEPLGEAKIVEYFTEYSHYDGALDLVNLLSEKK